MRRDGFRDRVARREGEKSANELPEVHPEVVHLRDRGKRGEERRGGGHERICRAVSSSSPNGKNPAFRRFS